MQMKNAFVKTQHKNNFIYKKTKAYLHLGSFNSTPH